LAMTSPVESTARSLSGVLNVLLLSGLFGGEAREAHPDFRARAVARARARQMI
jgi:hypothetical protein